MGPECGRAPPPHKWRETYADVQSPDAVTRAFPVATQITGKNAMAHLFISHSSRDGAAIAQPLVSALESVGHRCWIAPRDVKPGVPYPGQIVAAIRDCAGLVLIVTPAANESPDVLQEVQLAGQHRKTLAPVIVNRTTPSDDLHYYLGVRHQIPWSDASATSQDLLRSFPAGSAWSPSLASADAKSASAEDPVDVFMLMAGPNKINVIKVVREYTGMGLAETKTLVEGIPPIRVAMGMPRHRAAAFVKDLKMQGASMLDLVKARA